MEPLKQRVLLILGALVLVTVAFGGILWNWVAAKRAGPEALGRVPDFSVPAATAEGSTHLSLVDLKGHPWVADFIFTHCSGPCPLMTSKMGELQQGLPETVRLVSFSVDPDRDTLEVLTQYAKRYEADPKRWFFLRPDKKTLYGLVFDGFKLPMMEDPNAASGFRVTHSTKFVLVDGQGRIRGYFDSSIPDVVQRVRNAVTRLGQES